MAMMFDSPLWIGTVLRNPRVRKSIYGQQFKKFDADGNGQLEESELVNLVASISSAMKIATPSDTDLHEAFQQFDISKSSGLTLSEFSRFFDHFLRSSVSFMGKAEDHASPDPDPPNAATTAIEPRGPQSQCPDGCAHLTVKFLSGVVIADLTVESTLRVAELRPRVTKLAGFEAGKSVQALAWDDTKLDDSASLRDYGILGEVDLVATCGAAISGVFAEKKAGDCSTSASYETARAEFATSGTVRVWKHPVDTDGRIEPSQRHSQYTAAPETFWYTLGPGQQCHTELFTHTFSEHENHPLSKRVEQERRKSRYPMTPTGAFQMRSEQMCFTARRNRGFHGLGEIIGQIGKADWQNKIVVKDKDGNVLDLLKHGFEVKEEAMDGFPFTVLFFDGHERQLELRRQSSKEGTCDAEVYKGTLAWSSDDELFRKISVPELGLINMKDERFLARECEKLQEDRLNDLWRSTAEGHAAIWKQREQSEDYYEDYSSDHDWAPWEEGQQGSKESTSPAPRTKTKHTDQNRLWRDAQETREQLNSRKKEKRRQGMAKQRSRDQKQNSGQCGLALLGAAFAGKT